MVGAGIVLSPDVICDGFADGVPLRAQSHVHEDHMDYFERSKGLQDILCSRGTRDLLVAEGDQAMAYRTNIKTLGLGEAYVTPSGGTLTLEPSGHMLGATQVCVSHADGYRTGYSSDFRMPLAVPIQVDELVVDSTYGGPSATRPFSPADAQAELVKLFVEAQRRGSVVVRAHRGVLPEALECLAEAIRHPVYMTRGHANDCVVHRQHGALIPDARPVAIAEVAGLVRDSQPSVVCVLLGHRIDDALTESTTSIAISRAWTASTPSLQVGDRAWHVGLSGHADFEETLEYVKATGASLVLTDNIRGPHGLELAIAVRERLNIAAIPCPALAGRKWGGGS